MPGLNTKISGANYKYNQGLYWPFLRETTSHIWIPLTQGQ